MCLIIHFLAFDISEKFMTVMRMGIGNSGMMVSGKMGIGVGFYHGNGWEWGWEWFYGNGREWEQK